MPLGISFSMITWLAATGSGSRLLPEMDVLVIFLEPHTSISPICYTTVQAVPTWNHIAAQVYGTPRVISDHDELYELLRNLVEKDESKSRNTRECKQKKLPDEFVEETMGGVVGYQIEVGRIEARHKLSQNRKVEDFENVIVELNGRTDQSSPEVAEEMERVRRKPDKN